MSTPWRAAPPTPGSRGKNRPPPDPPLPHGLEPLADHPGGLQVLVGAAVGIPRDLVEHLSDLHHSLVGHLKRPDGGHDGSSGSGTHRRQNLPPRRSSWPSTACTTSARISAPARWPPGATC